MGIRKLLFVTVGAAVILTGCNSNTTGGSPPQGETQAPSSSETRTDSDPGTTTSASPAYLKGSSKGPAKNVPLPKMPKDAKKFSEEGASRFVEYYFDLLNYTIESNDVKEIKKLSSKECRLCNKSIIDEAEDAKKSGEWQVGGKHHSTVLDSYISGKNVAIVTVEYTADTAIIYSEPGNVQEELERLEPNRLAFDLEYNKGWRVYKIIGAD